MSKQNAAEAKEAKCPVYPKKDATKCDGYPNECQRCIDAEADQERFADRARAEAEAEAEARANADVEDVTGWQWS